MSATVFSFAGRGRFICMKMPKGDRLQIALIFIDFVNGPPGRINLLAFRSFSFLLLTLNKGGSAPDSAGRDLCGNYVERIEGGPGGYRLNLFVCGVA